MFFTSQTCPIDGLASVLHKIHLVHVAKHHNFAASSTCTSTRALFCIAVHPSIAVLQRQRVIAVEWLPILARLLVEPANFVRVEWWRHVKITFWVSLLVRRRCMRASRRKRLTNNIRGCPIEALRRRGLRARWGRSSRRRLLASTFVGWRRPQRY